MRKILILLCAAALTGCAWLGFGEESETAAANEPGILEEAGQTATSGEPAIKEPVSPAKKPGKAAKQPTKGKKSEEQIKVELDAMGKKLAAQSGRTIVPNKSRPEYKQVGKEWVASYIDVDSSNVVTSMRAGANGQYVGTISYTERFMECRGATKQSAITSNCKVVKTRNLKELIRYDGKEWQD